MMEQKIKNRGFSLVEIVVAAGIVSILGLILATMVVNQNREVAAIGEKMAAKDVELRVKNVVFNGSYCGCLFRGKTFNLATLTWNNFPSQIPDSYNQPTPLPPAPCVASTSLVVPAVGEVITSSHLKIANLSMTNVANPGPGYYTGDLEVSFDPSLLVRAMKNIKIPMSFNVDTTTGNFISCGQTQNMLKAWVSFVPPATVLSSYNVASVSSFGAGRYRVTFLSPMPNTNYAVNLSVGGTWPYPVIEYNSKTVNSFDLWTGDVSSGPVHFSEVSASVLGN